MLTIILCFVVVVAYYDDSFSCQGIIRHIMPAINLSYHDNGLHHNRGLCTVPAAHAWVTYLPAAAGMDAWKIGVATNKLASYDKWIHLATSTYTISKAIQ